MLSVRTNTLTGSSFDLILDGKELDDLVYNYCFINIVHVK